MLSFLAVLSKTIRNMKVQTQQNTQKQQLSRALRTALQTASEGHGGNAEVDALLKEFSETMDKIAAKLKENSPKAKGNDFNDFGIADISQAASAVVATKEVKPVEFPKAEKKADQVSEKEEDSVPAESKDKVGDVVAAPAQKPATSEKVKEVSEKSVECSDKEGKEIGKEGSKDVEAAAPDAVVPGAVKTSDDKAVLSEGQAVEVEPQVIAESAKAAPKASEPVVAKADAKETSSEVKPVEAAKSEAKQISADEAIEFTGGKDVGELPQTQMTDSVQAQAKLAAAFSNAISKMMGETTVLRPSMDREISVAAVASKHSAESMTAAKIRNEINSIAPTSNSAQSEGSLAKPFESLSRSDAPRAAKSLSAAASTRTMEKVETALKEAAKSRDGKTISLRLDPPELGAVKIDVSIRDGNLHARVVAETPAVNQLLRDKAHEMQSMLRKLGLHVDTVSVSVGSDSNASYERQASSEKSAQNFESFSGLGKSGVAQQASVPVAKVVEDHWVA